MVRRGVPFGSSEAAVLRGFRLDFTYPALERWLGGAADVVPAEGASVEGVLYGLVDESDLLRMDVWEGVHERAYVRETVEVEVPRTGERQRAWAYTVVDKRPGLAPSPGYIGQMLLGARRAGLSEDYLRVLEGHLAMSREAMGPRMQVLEALASEGRACSVDEVARGSGLPRERALALLDDLDEWGWAEADPTGRYSLRPGRRADIPTVTGSRLGV
jgi:hypothetical protein